MTSERFVVEMVLPERIHVGDVVWAPDDGDWLKIARLEPAWGGATRAFRMDGSEADFEGDQLLVKKVDDV